jgi:hypothetical protein
VWCGMEAAAVAGTRNGCVALECTVVGVVDWLNAGLAWLGLAWQEQGVSAKQLDGKTECIKSAGAGRLEAVGCTQCFGWLVEVAEEALQCEAACNCLPVQQCWLVAAGAVWRLWAWLLQQACCKCKRCRQSAGSTRR